MIYLYLKTHNKTGMKYLGRTISKDPYKYKGSGKYWTNHIKKHGYDVTTEILFESDDENAIEEIALYYSDKFNIVESKEFANLIIENGLDGGTHGGGIRKKTVCIHNGKETKYIEPGEEIPEGWFLGRSYKYTDEVKKKMSEARKGIVGRPSGWKHDEAVKEKMSKSAVKRCETSGAPKGAFRKGNIPNNRKSFTFSDGNFYESIAHCHYETGISKKRIREFINNN
jgi:hypothetical protein